MGGDSTINPKVFTDCDSDIDSVDTNNQSAISGHEISVLIEDSVIRQMALGIASFDFAAGNDRHHILWLAIDVIEIANDAHKLGS